MRRAFCGIQPAWHCTLSLHLMQNCVLPPLHPTPLIPLLKNQSRFPVTGSWLLLPSVQWLSRVRLFETPWTAACQASLSITNSQSLLKLVSIELAMPSNHLILCRPLLLLPLIFPSIRVFSSESALHIRFPKYWSFSRWRW